uniref:Uncharacterized protein n=1 Tax=candidate division WOR-3 bacterium TaxID=2052148 RepID=A0A7V0Z4T9_UNCW3
MTRNGEEGMMHKNGKKEYEDKMTGQTLGKREHSQYLFGLLQDRPEKREKSDRPDSGVDPCGNFNKPKIRSKSG